MNDRSRPPGASKFPLPLSSVTGNERNSPAPSKPVATPQTATRNAAHTAVQGGGARAPAGAPGARGPAYAQAPAGPLRAPNFSQTATLPGRPMPAAPAGPPARGGAFAQPGTAARMAAPTRAPAAALTPRSDMMASEAIRRAMAGRVARQGVKDQQVLAALEAVPRHMFIEPALSAQAYIDASLPIGHQQTISQPYIVARMIEAMREGGPLRRVLEIGTGCGYQAAVLACVAEEVYSIERIKPLHELAKTNLRPLRIANLRLQYGDGMLGLPQVAPFDGIILAAAGMEVPRALLEQLAVGGRLVAPVGAQVQHLQRITRCGPAEWTSETLEACHFVPLRPGIA
jgi:protein-L-isoaspartate(D-aspartate) O-methyltransferase